MDGLKFLYRRWLNWWRRVYLHCGFNARGTSGNILQYCEPSSILCSEAEWCLWWYGYQWRRKGNLTHFWRKVQINEYGKASETVRIQCDGSYEEREGYECYEKSSEVYIANVCQCDENMWNGANSLFFTTVLAVFVPLFARIWKYI